MAVDKSEYDLYSEENAPEIAYNAVVYLLRLENYLKVPNRTHRVMPLVYIEVDTYGWISIRSYHWFGAVSSEGTRWPVMQEILHYLQEWEYAELKPIGPEDAEWFATDKLLELPRVTFYP